MNSARLAAGLLLLVALILPACQPAPSTSATAVPPPAVTEPPTLPPVDHPGSTQPPATPAPTSLSPVIAGYELDVLIDPAAGVAEVKETIRFTAPSPDITLVVPPNGTPGVFTLGSLRWGDGTEIQDARLEGELLTFPLTDANWEGKEQEIRLDYQLDLPAGKGTLNNTGRQLNFGDWYPFLPVYDEDTGWLAHPAAEVGEHLVYDLADYDVTLRLDELGANWVVAASGPGESNPEGWHYLLKSGRSFAFSISDEYTTTDSYSNGVQILSYAFAEDAAAAEAARNTAADALALYQDLYSQYPHPTLSIVEADFPDGMEYDGLFFLGEEYYRKYRGEPLSYLIAIAAHETAHQWFFGLIGNDPAMEPWLDESLAAYSELLFYERYFPQDTAGWWNFRVAPYSPAGYVDGTIYDFAAFRPYVNAVYLRGAQFLADLRSLIGDEAFFAFLKDYASERTRKNPGSLVRAGDFFAILREQTGEDISSLVAEYFQHASP